MGGGGGAVFVARGDLVGIHAGLRRGFHHVRYLAVEKRKRVFGFGFLHATLRAELSRAGESSRAPVNVGARGFFHKTSPPPPSPRRGCCSTAGVYRDQ